MKKLTFILLLLFFTTVGNAQELRTGISVHDPVMIRQDSIYYLFCTGRGISMWSSKDMVNWKQEPRVFENAPQWAIDSVKGFKDHIWAPDISYHNGLYYLYYSVSAFGKNTSCIGVATNTTLHTNDASYKWVDHGIVVRSIPNLTNWNAIDPNLIMDKDDTPYLAFGSFWDGLKLVKLKPDMLSVDQPLTDLPTIASRQADPKVKKSVPAIEEKPTDTGGNAIEAPFIFRKGNYFYLFASIDLCCKGPKSTYKMIVGRSKKLQGPYKDSKGRSMRNGGGDIIMQGDRNWFGVGHNAVVEFNGEDHLIFHGYDANDKGISKLRIEKIIWYKGWPIVK